MRRAGPIAILLLCACSGRPHGSAPASDPVIAAIVPNAGPRVGGNVVRIEGSGFGDAPFVTFGAQNVTEFHSVSDTAIEIVAPPDLVGPASVTVVTAEGGRTTVVGGYYYLPLSAVAWDATWFASASQSSSANLVLVTTTNDAITGIDLEVPRAATGSIAGLLTGPGGEPLAGHSLVATRVDGSLPAIAMPSGVDGRFEIDGLPPGDWIVSTYERGDSTLVDAAFPGVPDATLASPVTVSAGQIADGVNLSLVEGATITGIVQGAAPLENVTVFAVGDASLQFTYGVTDSAGRYSLRGLAPGGYRLIAFAAGTDRVSTFWPDAFDDAGATPIAVTGTGTITADFDLPLGAAISGQVIEANSLLPLPQVIVVAHDVARNLDFSTATGVDGTYSLPPVPAGAYRLEAAELGQYYNMVTTTAGATLVVVSSGQSAPGRNWLGRLDPAPPCGSPATTAAFSGKVSGPGGAAVLRAHVELSGPGFATATTGVDGRWSVDCLPPGTWSIAVNAPGTDFPRRVLADVATVLPASATPIDVTLSHGASLAGQVRDRTTRAPLAGVLVEVEAVNEGETAFATTDPAGHWSVDRFPSGGMGLDSYRVSVPPAVQTEYFPY